MRERGLMENSTLGGSRGESKDDGKNKEPRSVSSRKQRSWLYCALSKAGSALIRFDQVRGCLSAASIATTKHGAVHSHQQP